MIRGASTLLTKLVVLILLITWAGHASSDPGTAIKAAEPGETGEAVRYAIAIHGGAGSNPANWSAEARQRRTESLTKVLQFGQKLLADGASGLDVVEQVINRLEDDPQFNAGRGAVMNAEGGHELDASIMNGQNLACGAVAGVRRVKNPISLARLVMTQTRHVLLSGAGAEQFAASQKIELVDPSYFRTEQARKSLERAKRRAAEAGRSSSLPPRKGLPRLSNAEAIHFGTVGCVVLDTKGNLAAGTSTGGLTNKMYGRIGDSPVVGAGTYADNRSCAVSCTGVGEHFIRNAVAYDISARMRYKEQSLSDAVGAVIEKTLQPNQGGVIAVDRQGNVAMRFNTPGMSRAAATSSGLFEVALGKGDQ